MKFLVDNQLPRFLSDYLRARGYESAHVSEAGMDSASDDAIIEYASSGQFVIITKDEDFSIKVLMGKCDVPVVWIRLGNCRNPVLQDAFDATFDGILERLALGERLIEVHP